MDTLIVIILVLILLIVSFNFVMNHFLNKHIDHQEKDNASKIGPKDYHSIFTFIIANSDKKNIDGTSRQTIVENLKNGDTIRILSPDDGLRRHNDTLKIFFNDTQIGVVPADLTMRVEKIISKKYYAEAAKIIQPSENHPYFSLVVRIHHNQILPTI